MAKPQLLSWQICDGVHLDPATGKHFLLGCFSNIRARQFPAKHPRMFWFLTLTDVSVGRHELKISYGTTVQDMKQVVQREFESRSPLHKINLVNEIQNLPFDAPGEFPIMIEIDDEPILVTSLGVGGPGRTPTE